MDELKFKIDEIRSRLTEKISDISGANIFKCYQCGRCSAGCPMAEYMDILPNQAVRLIQVGRWEDVANSNTPWVCAACLTCSVRCPRGVEIAEIMEAVRQLVLRDRDSTRRLETEESLDDLPPIALVAAFRKILE